METGSWGVETESWGVDTGSWGVETGSWATMCVRLRSKDCDIAMKRRGCGYMYLSHLSLPIRQPNLLRSSLWTPACLLLANPLALHGDTLSSDTSK